MEADAVWAMMESAETVYITKGRSKILTFSPANAHKEEILAAAIGRSGNLRAPTIQMGNTLIVGFTDDLYADVLGSA